MAPRGQRAEQAATFLPPGVLQIGQPELPDLIFRALQLKGQLPEGLDRQIQLGLQLDDWTRAEYAYLRRNVRAQIGMNVGPIAAQFGYCGVQLTTPRIVVIEQVHLVNLVGVAMQYTIGPGAAPGGLVGAGSGQTRDDRSRTFGGSNAPTACNFQSGTAVAPVAPANGMTFVVPVNNTLILNVDWVLTNFGFWVVCQTVNQTVTVNMVYREREALPTEL